MDRSLDDILSQKRTSQSRSRRNGSSGRGRNDNYPRDGVKKSYRDDSKHIYRDWVHDRFEDNVDRRSSNNRTRSSPSHAAVELQCRKLRVENIHYEITESELEELFNRIGPTEKVQLLYNRAGRSQGTAYIVYEDAQDAREAVRQFDGANANGQPIHLTAMATSSAAKSARNPFDTAVMPGSTPTISSSRRNRRRARTRSPALNSGPTAAPRTTLDRYVPEDKDHKSPRHNESGWRPGARRSDKRRNGRGGRRNTAGNSAGAGINRPQKTTEELDAEMEDYFTASNSNPAVPSSSIEAVHGAQAQASDRPTTNSAPNTDGDIYMDDGIL